MLMTILAILGYIVFGIVLLAGVIAAALGLPGTLIILVDAVIYSAITGWDRVPWWLLLIAGILALIAEGGDGFVAAWGTKAGGGSNKGGFAAMVGAIIGALIGGAVLSPILSLLGLTAGFIGFFVGIVLPPLAGGVAGGFAGAYYFERHTGKPHKEALAAGWGAFAGRMAAGLFKAVIGAMMIAIIVYSIINTAGADAAAG
jgi:uncharacterized protein YqgC (DUF456 family)